MSRQVAATTSAHLICVVAQLSVLIGYALGRGRQRTDPPRRHSCRARSWCTGALHRLPGAGLLLLPVATAIVVASRRGRRPGSSRRRRRRRGFSRDAGVFALVKLFPGQLCIVAALACIYLLRSAPHLTPSERSMTRFELFLSIVLLFLYANPFAHTWYIFLAAFGSIAVMALRTRGWRTSIAALLVALVAFLLAYPAASSLPRRPGDRLDLVGPSEPATTTGSGR